MDLLLEMELGVTGGEEDGVDNSDVDNSLLYTQPSEVYEVYKALSSVPNGMFTVAAAFGNVHGVYAPGNVKLTPEILHNSQKYIKEQSGTHAHARLCPRPPLPAPACRRAPRSPPPPAACASARLLAALFVGSRGARASRAPRARRLQERQARLLRLPRRLGLEPRGHSVRDRGGRDQDEHRHGHAVVVLGRHPVSTPRGSRALSLETRTRRCALVALAGRSPPARPHTPRRPPRRPLARSSYEAEFHPYLQGQIGNPESPTKPNKKYYDPRMPLRRGEEFTAKRLAEAMGDLNSINVCP